MSRSHLRFGYGVQIASILTLMLANVVLPNLLGAGEFSRLNEAYALVGFSCLVFSDGVSMLLVSRLTREADSVRTWPRIALRAVAEHVGLAIVGLVLVAIVVEAIAEGHPYRNDEWMLVGVTGISVALYVVVVGVLTSRLANHVVAILAVAQGACSVLVPLILHSHGMDVRWAIALSHLPGALMFAWWLASPDNRGMAARAPAVGPVALAPMLLPASAQTAMRLMFTWMPVLVLANLQDVEAASSYKIGLSLALGVCALVPYHKQTMISLMNGPRAKDGALYAAGALVLAAVGGVVLVAASALVVPILFRPEFARIEEFLPAFACFIVLQVFVDILLVKYVPGGRARELSISCVVAVMLSLAAMHVVPLHWVPAVTLAGFATAVLIVRRHGSDLALPIRAAVGGVVVSVVAVLLPSEMVTAGCGALIAGWMLCDKGMRKAVVNVLMRLIRGEAAGP